MKNKIILSIFIISVILLFYGCMNSDENSSIGKNVEETVSSTSTMTPEILPTPTEDITNKPIVTIEPTIESTSTPEPTIIITPTPQPTIEPTPVAKKCSMIDYTKVAMPNEIYKNEVNKILSSAKNGVEIIDASTTTKIEEKIFYSHKYLYYQLWYWVEEKNNTFVLYTEFPDKPSDAKEQYQKSMAWADNIIKELNITKETSEIDAVKKINNFMCNYFDYDSEAFEKAINENISLVEYCYLYDAISSKKLICEMYAQIFQLLCHKCGIECYFETNDTWNHAYNYVIINGKRLYIDVLRNYRTNSDVFLLVERKQFLMEYGWFENHIFCNYDYPYGY